MRRRTARRGVKIPHEWGAMIPHEYGTTRPHEWYVIRPHEWGMKREFKGAINISTNNLNFKEL